MPAALPLLLAESAPRTPVAPTFEPLRFPLQDSDPAGTTLAPRPHRNSRTARTARPKLVSSTSSKPTACGVRTPTEGFPPPARTTECPHDTNLRHRTSSPPDLAAFDDICDDDGAIGPHASAAAVADDTSVAGASVAAALAGSSPSGRRTPRGSTAGAPGTHPYRATGDGAAASPPYVPPPLRKLRASTLCQRWGSTGVGRTLQKSANWIRGGGPNDTGSPPPCCSCTRYSTCSRRPAGQINGCSCLAAGQKCVNCACLNRCRNRHVHPAERPPQ